MAAAASEWSRAATTSWTAGLRLPSATCAQWLAKYGTVTSSAASGFAFSKGSMPERSLSSASPSVNTPSVSAAAAATLNSATARPEPGDLLPAWQEKFGAQTR